MRSNFKIKDFRDIEFEGRHIDLHNNFDFVGCDYNALSKILLMKFEVGKGDWIKKDELARVYFLHLKVTYLNVNWEQQIQIAEDSTTLGEITFYPSSEREHHTNFLDRQCPLADDDLIYTFESGNIIRVCCEDVALQI